MSRKAPEPAAAEGPEPPPSSAKKPPPKQSATAKGQARRAAILEVARIAFLANGFQATSMQDILKASGLSPGAFYRYFPGKEALVRALIGEAIGRLSAALVDAVADTPTSIEAALRPALYAIESLDRTGGAPRIALMVWAEMLRDASLAAVVETGLKPMLRAIDALAAALVADGVVPDGSRPVDVAVAIGGILQGYVVQRVIFGVEPFTYARGLRAIMPAAAVAPGQGA